MATQATARLRYVSIPPRKMRLVARLVKGRPIEEAISILQFTPRIAARHLEKTVRSAAANILSVEGTDHLKPEDLFVKNVIVDTAPTQKRVRFQSMGRVFRYRKRFSHVTVIVEELPEKEKAVEPKAAPKKAKATARKTTAAAKAKGAKKPAAKKPAAKKTTKAKAKAEEPEGKPARAPKKSPAKKTTAKAESEDAGGAKKSARKKPAAKKDKAAGEENE
jgi:large subunit ribosomal protein L22